MTLRREPGEREQGGRDALQSHRLRDEASGREVRPGHEERHAGRRLVHEDAVRLLPVSESADAPYIYMHTMGPRDWQSIYQHGLAQGHIVGVVGSTDHLGQGTEFEIESLGP